MKSKALFLIIIMFVIIIGCTVKLQSLSDTLGEEIKKEEFLYTMKNRSVSLFNKENGAPDIYAGLRRSVYGLPSKNGDDGWWVKASWEFAYKMKTDSLEVEPCIIQIISGYNLDGTTTMGFKKPEDHELKSSSITFNEECEINHERALSLYDKKGVNVILQFESGNSDVLECIEIAQKAFGHHQCIIGYGIDAEWYFTKESSDNTGIPIPDNDAAKWLDKILSFNPSYTLFLKHWEPEHMPPTFRDQNLWFLSDSQMFNSEEEFMSDFNHWDSSYQNSITGYQYGYIKDKVWWKDKKNPPIDLGKRIINELPNSKFIFWVDFTADQVNYKDGGLL